MHNSLLGIVSLVTSVKARENQVKVPWRGCRYLGYHARFRVMQNVYCPQDFLNACMKMPDNKKSLF